jgi:hypothetical protein
VTLDEVDAFAPAVSAQSRVAPREKKTRRGETAEEKSQ